MGTYIKKILNNTSILYGNDNIFKFDILNTFCIDLLMRIDVHIDIDINTKV